MKPCIWMILGVSSRCGRGSSGTEGRIWMIPGVSSRCGLSIWKKGVCLDEALHLDDSRGLF